MKWFFIFLLVSLLISACTTQAVTPTRASRQIIDTSYQRQIILLQPEMDSLCASTHKIIFQQAVDSILTARQLEMDQLVK